jgi:deoxyxylulose-5-phosphate synthase
MNEAMGVDDGERDVREEGKSIALNALGEMISRSWSRRKKLKRRKAICTRVVPMSWKGFLRVSQVPSLTPVVRD